MPSHSHLPPAFIPFLPLPLSLASHRPLQSQSLRPCIRTTCTITPPHPPPHPSNPQDPPILSPDITYDELVSDDNYVVIDGKEVASLVEELQLSGLDQFGDLDDDDDDHTTSFADQFLNLAEKRSDQSKSPTKTPAPETETPAPRVKEFNMCYFQDENIQFMPAWLAESYRNGDYIEFQEEASRLGSEQSGGRRLQDIVERKRGVGEDMVGMDGIVDCTVAHVAMDYGVPVEFVVDAMLAFGVDRPINVAGSVRDCMTTEEIERLLRLVGSFDGADLWERYSDRSLMELADNYDLKLDLVIEACKKEGLELCMGERTRLSAIKEDRILDILLKGGSYGKPYPSSLDGLE